MRTYSPGGLLIALAAAPMGPYPPTPSNHRLRRGLPGYLILFAPHAFEPQRQLPSSKPPSPLVFFLISTHFTATLGIPLTSPALQPNSFQSSPGVKHRAFTSDLPCRLPFVRTVQLHIPAFTATEDIVLRHRKSGTPAPARR